MSHDPAYKLLFSFPELVADLLRGFVHEDWVEQLDFATLEKVNRSFVSEDLRGREDDVIWRVRWGPEWLYVYLLLEFQSLCNVITRVRKGNSLAGHRFVRRGNRSGVAQELWTGERKL